MKTQKIILAALFASLLCIGAYIKIPLPQLPITMQVFFLLLAGLVLDYKAAIFSVLVYIFLGLLGLPVFAGGGGVGYVLNPSFGYIIGFLAAGVAVSRLCEKTSSFKGMFLCTLAGIFIIYVTGTVYFSIVSKFLLSTPITFKTLVGVCILPMIPGDIISAAIAVVAARRINKIISKL